MKRRILALALVITMMMGFVVPVYADFYEFSSIFEYIENDNYDNKISGSLSDSYSGSNWSWNGSKTTLTLNGTTENQRFDLYNPSSPVTLVVNGTNALYYLDNYDVYSDEEDMTITGSGSLTVRNMFGQDIYCKGPDITFTSQAVGTYYAEEGTLTFRDYASPSWGETNPISGGAYVIDMRQLAEENADSLYFYNRAALSFEIGAEYGTMPDYFKDLAFQDENGDPVSFQVMTQTGTYSDGDYYVSVKKDGSLATYIKITNPGNVPPSPDPDPTPDPDPEPSGFDVEFTYTDPDSSGSVLHAYYDDSFFEAFSYNYNHDLAWLTLCMELSAWSAEIEDWGAAGGNSSSVAKNRYANIADAYAQMDFRDVTYYNYGKSLNDTTDTVAYSIAKKKLSNGSTLMAVVVRGGNYGAHWAGNFNVGDGSVNHTGFTKPAEEVYNQVLSQLGTVPGNVKLWITGYSRGAAVANILAARLDDYAGKTTKFAAGDIYTYTFATPQGVASSGNTGANLYKNIFNIVNPGDIVPQVAPDAWGYGRYGETLYFDSYSGQVNTSAVNKSYKSYGGESYKAENNASQRTSEIALLDILTRYFPTATSSVNFQKAIQGLLEYTNTKKAAGSRWENITLAEYDRLLTTRHGSTYTQAYARAETTLEDSLSGKALKTLLYGVENSEAMMTTLLAICETNGLSATHVTNLLCSILMQNLSVVTDMIKNPEQLSALAAEHVPAAYLSWISHTNGYDDYIDSSEAATMGLRVAQIACPVDILVYDAENHLVAEIRNHEIVNADIPVVTLEESTTLYFNRGNAEEYRLEIIPTDNGTMTYTVTEYDMEQQLIYRANYLDISIETDQTYTGTLIDPAPDPQDRIGLYVEEGNASELLSPDQTLTGDHPVALSAQVQGKGTVSGTGTYVPGDTACLTASPDYGYTFAGWYRNGKLLSDEPHYNLRVDTDTEVLAKFVSCSHSWNRGDVLIAPTQTDAGTKIFVCTKCFEIKTSVIPALGGCDGGNTCPLHAFSDVKSTHWAHPGMDFAVNNGLMNGTGSGTTFEPDTNMSRAMLVTVLWRHSGAPEAPDCSFPDVKKDDWFYPAVAWAASEGVVNGMGDGSFAPNGDVTREMMATILYRYARMTDADISATTSISDYPDADSVASWSSGAMKWAVAEGIISGAVKDGKTVLAPQDSANRAVVATIMMRFIQNVVEK